MGGLLFKEVHQPGFYVQAGNGLLKVTAFLGWGRHPHPAGRPAGWTAAEGLGALGRRGADGARGGPRPDGDAGQPAGWATVWAMCTVRGGGPPVTRNGHEKMVL